MTKIFVFSACLTMLFACGGTAENGNESGNDSGTKWSNTQPLDDSGKPIPGIPGPGGVNLSNQPPGATPTPGIPEANKIDITNQKGATPTPGIPDAATRRRMVEELKRKSADPVNTAPAVTPDSGKTTKGPLDRPRKTQP